MDLKSWLEIIFPTLIGILTIKLSHKSFRHVRVTKYAQERYEKVIYPIFRIIEPYMIRPYGTPLHKDLQLFLMPEKRPYFTEPERRKILKYVKVSENIVGENVFQFYNFLSTQTSEKDYKSFQRFCICIESEYSKLLFELGLPPIPWRKRLKYHWPFSKKVLWIKLLILALTAIIELVMILAFVILYGLFLGQEYTTAIIFSCVVLLILIILLKN